MELLEAAREGNQGHLPEVVSGYRTWEKQQSLYDAKVEKYRGQGYSEEEARALAEEWAAPPGYSEHQAGLAVDLSGVVYDLYFWLQENSWRGGGGGGLMEPVVLKRRAQKPSKTQATK